MFDLIPASPLSLGKPTKGRRLRLNVKDNTRTEHMHVIGATNSGKSRFLLSLIQQDILEGRGLCLIDPHGELYDHIVAWLLLFRLRPQRRKGSDTKPLNQPSRQNRLA